MCITSIVRPLACGSEHLPSAPTNILPLLRLVMPGIDPNDFRKSMCTFNFISAVISLIPLVNCMPALHAGIEMSEVERELCLASDQFEDLILQFMDRYINFLIVYVCMFQSLTLRRSDTFCISMLLYFIFTHIYNINKKFNLVSLLFNYVLTHSAGSLILLILFKHGFKNDFEFIFSGVLLLWKIAHMRISLN